MLVVTGIFLALFFHASQAHVVYHGSYQPLAGVPMSDAYSSVLDLSLNVRAGLLIRQVHHWAALVFVAALIIHLMRMFFTGAYRRPRRINWLIGLSLLLLVGFNGLMGYSLPDDLLSGTGLRIAYSITESIPFIGPDAGLGAVRRRVPDRPGSSRASTRCTSSCCRPPSPGCSARTSACCGCSGTREFPGPGRDDRTMVGTPMVPAYALRTTGYFLLLAGVLTAFGAFLQINPVWLYGPFRATDATTSAQPDWYMGWLEGAVRMFPGWDIQIGGFLLPAIFWPAVVLPGLIFTPLFLWPWLDWLAMRDNQFHNVLQYPSAAPRPHGDRRRLLHVPHRAAGRRRRRRVRQRVRLEPAGPAAHAAGPGHRAAADRRGAHLRDRAPEVRAVARLASGSSRWPATAAATTTARYGPETLNSAQAARRSPLREQPRREASRARRRRRARSPA